MGRCRAVTAKRGEDAAARFLSGRGYRILERNVRTGCGEIDIVARAGQTLVFVEVKSRSGVTLGPPSLAVTPRKMAHIIRNSCCYLRTNGIGDSPWRIDVVSVLFRNGSGEPEIVLYTNAGEDPYV